MVFLAFVEFAFISFIGIFIRRLKITDAVIITSNLILANLVMDYVMDMLRMVSIN